MTDRTPTAVEAQWAVHGKRLDRLGYRVLACSTGQFSAQNFEEAISRFGPGTPGALPQVTLSYLKPRHAEGNYLALAIHRYADDMSGGDGQLKYDDDGRRIVVTRYFCLPYLPLAEQAVSYQAMFRALDSAALPAENGPPIRVAIAAPGPASAAVDDLTMQAAALLLTTRPVCVLGADDTSLAGRLAFIDAVMSLLPYGLRAKMTAATWTRPTNRDHRFQLFFSDAARTADRPDNILYWGRPEETRITPGDDWAYEYVTWLRDKIEEPTAKLARVTEPTGFGRDQVLRVLDDVIGIVGSDPRLNYSETRQDYLHPRHVPRAGSAQGQSYGEMILSGCGRHVAAGDQVKIKSDVSLLRNIVDDPANHQHRARYQEILRDTGLLRYSENLGGNASRLYEYLLRVAFQVPLDYAAYCQVEDCLADTDGGPPHAELLRAIGRCGVSDQRVMAITRWHLRVIDEPALTDWYLSGEVTVVDLIGLLSARWERPRHARAVCDVLLDYLARMRSHIHNPNEVRRALRSQGFLAHALQASQTGHEQYQVSTLYTLLRYGYQSGLDRNAIIQVLTAGNDPPTAPLLAAVLLYAEPWLAELAADAYTHALMQRAVAVTPAISRRIEDRLPVISAVPPGTGPTGTVPPGAARA